jgi:hypothetical protein
MKYSKRKQLSIVTEAVLESRLIRDIKELGAHGYTIWDARGEGTRGVRGADWEGSRNIYIQVICDTETADRIADHLSETYYAHYAMVMTIIDVEVMRPEKF